MLVEIYIFFQVVVIGVFFASFYTKNEILWALTSIFSAALMFSSYNIEQYVPVFNQSLGAYSFQTISYQYPYLMAINAVFFMLSIVLGMFDLFDKYGFKIFKKKEK